MSQDRLRKYDWIDACRGVAILLVVWCHAFGPAFLLGIAGYHLRDRLPSYPALLGALATVCLGLSYLVVSSLLVGKGLIALMPTVEAVGFVAVAGVLSRAGRFPDLLLEMGRRSFSIYILHFATAFYVFPPLFTRYLPSVPGPVVGLVSFVATTALAYGAAGWTTRLVERPGVALGNRLVAHWQGEPGRMRATVEVRPLADERAEAKEGAF